MPGKTWCAVKIFQLRRSLTKDSEDRNGGEDDALGVVLEGGQLKAVVGLGRGAAAVAAVAAAAV